MAEPDDSDADDTPEEGSQQRPALDTRDLFAGQREIVIEHEGVRYRLRITRRNKLILQK